MTRPVQPFREFVLKVHQRCNLACDYCYVYTKQDQSWRTKPRMMAPRVVATIADRIAEHAARHRLPEVRVVLHGGEPLLAGVDSLVATATTIRRALPAGCRPTVGIQTNGVLLDRAAIATFARHDIRVGVSIDGPAADHDRHRRFANGAGSHAAVDRALRLLADHRTAYAGLLCTIDLRTDPVECYENLLRYGPPVIDFLLPYANWMEPPAWPEGEPTAYGAWLAAIFDRWYGAPRRETGVRLLEEIINLILGGASRIEHVGLSPFATVVVDSDGSVELVDALKTAYPGAPRTGLNVRTHSFDLAARHPGVIARQAGVDGLAPTCRACRIHRVCGGGNYAHRYRAGTGFDNPSVYCGDLTYLIDHVQRRVASDLARLVPEPA